MLILSYFLLKNPKFAIFSWKFPKIADDVTKWRHMVGLFHKRQENFISKYGVIEPFLMIYNNFSDHDETIGKLYDFPDFFRQNCHKNHPIFSTSSANMRNNILRKVKKGAFAPPPIFEIFTTNVSRIPPPSI